MKVARRDTLHYNVITVFSNPGDDRDGKQNGSYRYRIEYAETRNL